ncbi:MAG: complex I NDUFA9 subunit family protein [Gammaproteobacteria bacterium]|nr:complex I NDUFA9 subunit family protein [Gammaproteobacteria bacterium]MCP5407253.1 complex I NDUFA9 subunit family protein [Chromatiaceae bacterium]MCP5408192.1 complex I NDUFA9 subunit family protein [Chromatiaceae bacterium]MCP5442003.1 complex I NDUFA9 subunit family protein [Chromatiaceae bacterium]
MSINKVCILGGTGFVGSHLTCRMNSYGIHVRIPTRHPQRHRELMAGGRVELINTNPFDRHQLEAVMDGCDAAVNLVGILNETHAGKDFQHIHIELADRVVEACKASGVSRLLHMSALNANESNGPSVYLKTKGEAENRTHTLGKPQIKVTSFRPSVIFGPGDSFFNRFASLLGSLPGPFPLACPEARFAPVYVGDVVGAFVRALDDKTTWDKHYELCGPDAFTLLELVEYTARQSGLKKRIIGLGDGASRLQARILGHVPGKPFSYDNYLSLQVNSLCSKNGLLELGISPTSIDTVVPYMLSDKSVRRRYQQLRRQI